MILLFPVYKNGTVSVLLVLWLTSEQGLRENTYYQLQPINVKKKHNVRLAFLKLFE